MTEKYNQAAERLWEKLEGHRTEFKIEGLDLQGFSPWDKFCRTNPQARELAAKVNKELSYELSDAQCSWAVLMTGGNITMEDYNKRNRTSLHPRA